MFEVKAGMEVRIFDQNGRHMAQPPDGWPGLVTAVGQEFFTVDYRNGDRQNRFRLSNGRSRDGFRWAMTVEQAKEVTLRAELQARLGTLGIHVDINAFSVGQMDAIVALVSSFKAT